MRTMVAAGWICFLYALLSLEFAEAHNHSEETDSFHVSVGHLFLLKCYSADVHSEVIWSRGNNSSLPSGVELRDGLLLFLPVQTSHHGTYTCEQRNDTKSRRMTFRVLVSSENCTDPPEVRSIQNGTSGSLYCKQDEILKLNNTWNVRWMKDCQPMQREGEPISVDRRGNMMLPEASESDAGKYTCLVDINLNGRTYTASRSVQLTITDDPVIIGTVKVREPQHQVVRVKVGERVQLNCSAYTGFAEDYETSIYWTVNDSFSEDHKELNVSSKYFHERGKVYFQSTLTISEVRRQFLNVPIKCIIWNPFEKDEGVAFLQEGDHTALYMTVSAFLVTLVLVTLVLATSFYFLKVDLVLAYRKLLRHFPKEQVLDGKLYDAYVSFLHSDNLSADVTASFALNILPEELEDQHGYLLYIRGRDDCPGEAMHDAIAATVHQCRRLIIVLSSDTITREMSPLHENQNQLCYEQKVGIHDALTQNDPRVILVEIDGPVDYNHLPVSLRYIKRKQGALKWKKDFLGTQKLTKLHSNRNFWKNLRYHMPPVPARRLQTVV
ncbi:interleukin-1 receptor type 1-like [Acanthochromis polyacanthus]|uniref:interleukin-1 receptor type 1-like n=1 Tax=Acanthochromis polyacanthus TaxID=80966 RepID=UPI00223451C3|nr:interleukin-1 receptor type 1-like [Acanthochromis polyacanthus]